MVHVLEPWLLFVLFHLFLCFFSPFPFPFMFLLCTNYYSCGIMVQFGRGVDDNFNIHVLACSGEFITGGGWVQPTI